MNLFMVLLGAMPPGRNTEQHDVFFGIGESINSLKQDLLDFWPESLGKLHIDAWRKVNIVDGFEVRISGSDSETGPSSAVPKLFFLNLGGYRAQEFEEFHYKILIASLDKGEAVRRGKETVFYKHTGFPGAESHIDEKYGVDIDDLYEIEDILPEKFRKQYRIQLEPASNTWPIEDELFLGYLKWEKL